MLGEVRFREVEEAGGGMNGVSVLSGGIIKVLNVDDIYFVKLEDYEKQENENVRLQRQIDMLNMALNIAVDHINDINPCPEKMSARNYKDLAAEIEKEAKG